MSISRRNFLKAAGLVGVSSVVPYAYLKANGTRFDMSEFRNPLAIPPEDKGKIINGKKVFELALQHGSQQFYRGFNTPTYGINGNYLGPVLRLKKDDEAVIKVTNNLSETSTIHWHGVHLPAAMDGGPHQPIPPSATRTSAFTIKQRASTQWYHSHMHERTAEQVYYGLAGLFYIDDDQSESLSLPNEYGVNDIPLVLQDRMFNQDGTFQYISNMHTGMMGLLGHDMLVNGVLRPKHNVPHKYMRLRLLNGSNSRIYNLSFSDNRHFIQIASDGGLLPESVSLRELLLAPGERAEVIVEFGVNDDVMLRHTSNKLSGMGGMRGMMSMMTSGTDHDLNIMRFVTDSPVDNKPSLPMKLAMLPNWNANKIDQHRKFDLDMVMMSGFTINGRQFNMKRIDAMVRLNNVEVWEFRNNTPMPHPMHIHDIQFKILSRNGRQPPLNERGLKDTVLVQPDEIVRVITKFENYADPKSPYMFHCHNLEHEDRGMMGQFVVV